jgi:hypothetical protein
MPSQILKDAQGRPTHVTLTIEEYRDLQKALAKHPAVTEGLKRLQDPSLKTYTMEEVAHLAFGNHIRACRERADLTQDALSGRGHGRVSRSATNSRTGVGKIWLHDCRGCKHQGNPYSREKESSLIVLIFSPYQTDMATLAHAPPLRPSQSAFVLFIQELMVSRPG